MSNNNLVSIIIPCYNQDVFLSDTLESIKNQTYNNWECLIINDGSPDDTEKIAKFWTEKDSRFRYFKKQNGGLSSARNFGLQHAEGNWIQFLDSDDILEPTKISESLSYTHNNDIVITNFLLFNGNKQLAAYCDLSKQIFNLDSIISLWDIDFTIPIHCALFKKDLINDTRFNQTLKAKEDWLFWTEIYIKNPKTYFLNKNLSLYRIHKDSMTKDTKKMYENTFKAYQIIFEKLDVSYKSVFFKRIIEDYYKIQTNYNNLIELNDVYTQLEEYKKYKKKYYNIWYKKLFYWFKTKKS